MVLLKLLLILPETLVSDTQVSRRHIVSWICLLPEFIGLARLFQVACNKVVVVRFDIKILALAHPAPQFVGFPRLLRTQTEFSEIEIACPKRGIGHGEIRVQEDGPLEQGHSVVIGTFRVGLPPQAIGFEGFKRWRGGLLKRGIELMHRA